jgi:predicted HTH domain antitoxin
MTTMTMSFPETVFSSTRWSPDEFVREMRIEAATQWYSQKRISQERAADIAGLTRSEFIDALALRRIPVVQTEFDEIMDEVRRV